MIKFTKKTAQGEGWSKVWYLISRNGHDTGFVAFKQDDGTFTVERDDRWEGEFANLQKVANWASKQPKGFQERLSEKGIFAAPR